MELLLILVSVLIQQCAIINGESCPASTPTLKEVKTCPETDVEWSSAAAVKQCQKMDSHNCKSFKYHCLMNQNEDTFLEVCAPTWYISGFCAMYNTDEERVIDNFKLDCTNLTKEQKCPPRYISTDAYKYKWCYDHARKNMLLPITNGPEYNTSKEEKKTTGSGDNTAIVLIVLVAVFAVAIVIQTILLILARKRIIWKHDREDEENKKQTNAEMVKVTNNVPINAERTQDKGASEESKGLLAEENEKEENADMVDTKNKSFAIGGRTPDQGVGQSTDNAKDSATPQRKNIIQELEDVGKLKRVKGAIGQRDEKDTVNGTEIIEDPEKFDFQPGSEKREKKNENSNNDGKNDEDVDIATEAKEDPEKFDFQPGSEKMEKKNENSNNDGENDEDVDIATEATEDPAGHNGSGMLDNSCHQSDINQVQGESGDTCSNKVAVIDRNGIPIQETGQNGSAMESSPLKSDNNGHGDLQNSITEGYVESVSTNAYNTDEVPRNGDSNKTT